MRSTTSLCGSAILVGLAALWSVDAAADYICTPCQKCNEVCTTVPARYTAGVAGDVALITPSGTSSDKFLAPIISVLGLKYSHAMLLSDSTGNHFTESDWTSTPADSTNYDNAHPCSRVISPWDLQRGYPGVEIAAYQDALPGELINFGTNPACKPPADTYHIRSFMKDSLPGGSCEKVLVESCGVPVNDALDRSVYPGSAMWDIITGSGSANGTGVFSGVYATCMGQIGGTWPEILSFLGIQGLGCGSSPESVMCARAAYQVINEILYDAYPLNYQTPTTGGWFAHGIEAPNGEYYLDGWSDFNNGYGVQGANPPLDYNVWTGTMLGAAKTEYQSMPDGSLCPGACNTTGCNKPPVPCSAYSTSFTGNFPDNIANAAKRLGKAATQATAASGIAASYQSCQNDCYQTTCCE
jgi:hypothetical protein